MVLVRDPSGTPEKSFTPISALVTYNLNGDYYAKIEAPEALGIGRIVELPTPKGVEKFRVYTTTDNERHTAVANHLCYDLNAYTVSKATRTDATAAACLAGLNFHDFTVTTDLTGKRSFEYEAMPLFDYLKLVAEQWGAFLVIEGYTITLTANPYANAYPLQLREGYDAITLTKTVDTVDKCTNLWAKGDGVSAHVYDSSQLADDGIYYTKIVQFDTNDAATLQKLAQSYLNTHLNAATTYDVRLSSQEIGYTGQPLALNFTDEHLYTRVRQTVYNAVTGRVEAYEIGDVKKSIRGLLR